MNEQLLQAFDGLPVADNNEHVRCDECNTRLREGNEVIAQLQLDDYWRPSRLYHPDCYVDSKIGNLEETGQATVEARLIARHDRAEQTVVPALHTRDGYKLLRYSRTDEVTTGGGEEQDSRVSREELLEELQRLADEGERTPKVDDLKEQGQYPYAAYHNEFGSWNEALSAAGLTSNDDPDGEHKIGGWDE